MEPRKQFTFYRSFWDAIKGLPKRDRLPILEAVISYALDGDSPESLTQAQFSFFLLVKPTLDSARKKAASGKQGGSKNKQTECKTKAKSKQTSREKKREKEKEVEKENECYTREAAFDAFWSAYPKKVGKGDARRAFLKVKVSTEILIAAVEKQKCSAQWTKDGGQFIPNPATWLNQGRWEDELPSSGGAPKGAAGELGAAEIEAIQRALKGGGECC